MRHIALNSRENPSDAVVALRLRLNGAEPLRGLPSQHRALGASGLGGTATTLVSHSTFLHKGMPAALLRCYFMCTSCARRPYVSGCSSKMPPESFMGFMSDWEERRAVCLQMPCSCFSFLSSLMGMPKSLRLSCQILGGSTEAPEHTRSN